LKRSGAKETLRHLYLIDYILFHRGELSFNYFNDQPIRYSYKTLEEKECLVCVGGVSSMFGWLQKWFFDLYHEPAYYFLLQLRRWRDSCPSCAEHIRLTVAMAEYVRWWLLQEEKAKPSPEFVEITSREWVACKAAKSLPWSCQQHKGYPESCVLRYFCAELDKKEISDLIEMLRCSVLCEARRLGIYSAWRHVPAISRKKGREQ
jgi:hypothetical protein